MRPLIVLFLTACCVVPAAAQQPIVDQFEERTQTFEGLTLPYRLFVPEAYDPEVAYPLVLALHGAGERGSDNERHIRLHRLATSWADPVNQAEHPAFVVAPQVPSGARWSAEQPVATSEFTAVQRTTLALLDSLDAEFNIDPDRVYITGLSMGGHGTWDFIARLPDRFAAAAPMSGRADPTQAEKLLDLPIWAFHGESDTVVPASGSRRIVQAMEDLGRRVIYTDCRRSPPLATNVDCPGTMPMAALEEAIDAHADLIFTSVRNGGHGPWTVWYDHPLLADWLFSKHRLDADALALTAPAEGVVWSGTNTITWNSPRAATDTVEVWLSTDNGTTWMPVDTVLVGDGSYALDTSAYPDTPLAQVRLFVKDADGFVVGRQTSDLFLIDNAGDAPPFLQVDDEALRFDPEVTSETLDLPILAADPEQATLTADVFYSIDGGQTFAQAASMEVTPSQEPQPLSIDVAALPNTNEAQLRIALSDGANQTSATTATFVKQTPRADGATVEHVAGEGGGTITTHVIDPAALTGHRYRITFDATDPFAKTYSVTDLDASATVLTDIPLSDGVRESPVFDGLALVVEDLAEGMADLDATGWVEGDTDLGVMVSGGTVRIAILTIDLLATEHTYDLTMTEAIADTSVEMYRIPEQPMYFAVTSPDDGQRRDVVFDDADNDGRPGDGDVLYLLEPDAEGELAPAWELRFSATDATVLPEAGDTFRLVPLRSLSADDVFEFVGTPVAVETPLPSDEAVSLVSYPNPFAERATIVYRVPTPAAVSLEVFDLLGRRVARLVDASVAAGEHRLAWTSRDARLANGLYVLRLTARPHHGGSVWQVQRSVVRVMP